MQLEKYSQVTAQQLLQLLKKQNQFLLEQNVTEDVELLQAQEIYQMMENDCLSDQLQFSSAENRFSLSLLNSELYLNRLAVGMIRVVIWIYIWSLKLWQSPKTRLGTVEDVKKDDSQVYPLRGAKAKIHEGEQSYDCVAIYVYVLRLFLQLSLSYIFIINYFVIF